MSADLAIETTRLGKQFGAVSALVDVSLTIPRGAVCALVGRNGAGKTTTMRMLFGMIRPSSGTAQVLGLPISDPSAALEIRRHATFVDPSAIYPTMTVGEVLQFARGCYTDWDRAREVAGIFALDLPVGRKVSDLSKGTRTKLALLLSLARNAELLMFDEPTDGLDPIVREQVLRSLIAINAEKDCTVLISSHQLAEVEEVANWLCVLDRGQLVLSGELDEIRASHHRVDVHWPVAPGSEIPGGTGIVAVTLEGAFGSLLVRGDVERAVALAGATLVRSQVASLKEIVLAYAAPDVGNAQWVLQGVRNALA